MTRPVARFAARKRPEQVSVRALEQLWRRQRPREHQRARDVRGDDLRVERHHPQRVRGVRDAPRRGLHEAVREERGDPKRARHAAQLGAPTPRPAPSPFRGIVRIGSPPGAMVTRAKSGHRARTSPLRACASAASAPTPPPPRAHLPRATFWRRARAPSGSRAVLAASSALPLARAWRAPRARRRGPPSSSGRATHRARATSRTRRRGRRPGSTARRTRGRRRAPLCSAARNVSLRASASSHSPRVSCANGLAFAASPLPAAPIAARNSTRYFAPARMLHMRLDERHHWCAARSAPPKKVDVPGGTRRHVHDDHDRRQRREEVPVLPYSFTGTCVPAAPVLPRGAPRAPPAGRSVRPGAARRAPGRCRRRSPPRARPPAADQRVGEHERPSADVHQTHAVLRLAEPPRERGEVHRQDRPPPRRRPPWKAEPPQGHGATRRSADVPERAQDRIHDARRSWRRLERAPRHEVPSEEVRQQRERGQRRQRAASANIAQAYGEDAEDRILEHHVHGVQRAASRVRDDPAERHAHTLHHVQRTGG